MPSPSWYTYNTTPTPKGQRMKVGETDYKRIRIPTTKHSLLDIKGMLYPQNLNNIIT